MPPTHGSRPPDVPPPVERGHWYRRGWVIALGALIIGAVIGSAASSTKTTPRAATVTAPAQTVVQTVPGPTRTKTVARVRRVPGPATTVTQTVSASTSAPATTTPSSSSGAQSPGNFTTSQQNAVGAAKDYLSSQGFSKQGLINQLSSSAGDGYSLSDAPVAVDSLQVDWNAQAVSSAKDYLQSSSFSCQGLIDQLSSSAGDQYTAAQAQYAATKVGLC